MPESIELLQHKVYVLLCLGLVGDDGPEEVGQLAQGLVTDHHAASLHHATLENCSGFTQLILPPVVPFLISQPLWNVPEAHVGALWLWDDEIELVWHAVDSVHLIVGKLHQPVLLLLKANVTPGSPLQPQLEDVIVTPTLDHLVSSVVAAIVTLVCLEEVIRRHLIAIDQKIILLYMEC